MRFPYVISRSKPAGNFIVLGSDGTLGTPPTAVNISKAQNPVCELPRWSNTGWPGHRVAVSYKCTGTPVNLDAEVWFFDSATSGWYKIEAKKTLVGNFITYFDAITLADPVAGQGAGSGGVKLFLMVEDTGAAANNGDYFFGVGLDLTPLAV